MLEREDEVKQFCAAQQATRLHILTMITPLSPRLQRFVLIERAAEAVLRVCTDCRLSADLEQGDDAPVAEETLADFLRRVDGAAAAWDEDAVPDDVLDGLTIILERATTNDYAITHVVAPRANSPHRRLIDAWRTAFPVVGQAFS